MTVALAELADYDALGEFSIDPDGTRIAYLASSGDTAAVWMRGLAATAEPRLVWTGSPVERCVWRPDGARLVVQTNPGGRENYQLGELDPDSGAMTWLTSDAGARHEIGPPARTGNQPYSPDGTLLAFASNGRDSAVFDILVHDVSAGHTRTVFEGDDRYFPVSFSPDGDRLLIIRMRQNTDHDLFTITLSSGVLTHITPHDGPARYVPGPWAADGRTIYAATTQGRDFAGLAQLDAVGDRPPRWLATPPHEVDYVTRSGTRLLWATNVDGYSRLHVRDLDREDEQALDRPSQAVVARDMGRGPFAPQLLDDGGIVTGVATATAPTEVCLLPIDGMTKTPLTRSGARVPRPRALTRPVVVRYPSTDDVTVPALVYRPSTADASTPAPVVVVVHGGPEVQALPVYDPLIQYLVNRGIGVIAPNYRGSSGYGLAYQRMIYRDFGGGDLRDLASTVDYLRTVDWADSGKLGVFGVSYGGFAVLSCISRLPDLWTAAVEQCGRSDLTTAAVPPHWRARMREWVGDPDDDADMLREHSPINHAVNITAPLLVIHGENDTRVPKTESDRIVERMRALNKDVEYLVLPGDGHSATSRGNALAALEATANWFIRHLCGAAVERDQSAST